jgi:hypothetical protein
MKEEIVRKIASLLDRLPLVDEPQVVYLLVEIRKVLERDDSLVASMPTLEFYCNWALHTRLDRSVARRFLETVNPILTLQGNHNEQQQNAFDHLLTLNALRTEARAFLEANGLSAEICIDEGHWQSFLLVYSRVVEKL